MENNMSIEVGDIVTPNCEFGCDITGAGVLMPGQRMRVTRVFGVSRGETRVAVACTESGDLLCCQVPPEWLEVVE